MKRQDLQNAFGPAPDEFKRMVNDTLNELEDQNMRKRTKFSTALIAAVLVMTLLAGTAFAVSKLEIWKAFDYAAPLIPLPSADALVETNLASAENEYFRVLVQEGVYDGYGAVVKLHFEPKDSEKYVVISSNHMEGDLNDDNFIFETTNYPDEGYEISRCIGRKDGKTVIALSTPHLTTAAEPENAEALGIQTLFDTYREEYNPADGSLDYWISGMSADKLPEVLSILLNVSGMDADYNFAYGAIDNLSFDLKKSNQERVVKLVPVDGKSFEAIELIDAQIVFTEVRGYITIDHKWNSSVESPEDCWIHILDANGKALDGSGSYRALENGSERMTCAMQTYETLPDTLTLQLKYIDGGPVVAEIECKLEPIT